MEQLFESRLRAFIAEMEKAKKATNRQEAFDLVFSIWIAIHQKYGTPDSDLLALKHMQLCAAHGWHDLDKDPCYLNSPEGRGLRLHLHHNGTIVLQNYVDASLGIVFTKPGAVALAVSV